MKTNLGVLAAIPTAIALVGAVANGRPTYTTIAGVGGVGRTSISISVGKRRYVNDGIKKNKTFSVNFPSENLVKETDYCGMKSGREIDKGKLFHTFYGKLRNAPMIEECPLEMECRVTKTFDTPTHDVYIGVVVSTYCEGSVLVEDNVDLGNLRPIIYCVADSSYWKLGSRLANAWEVGKDTK